jgi:hypothetical protein
MERFKRLTFQSFQFFRDWYLTMKLRINTLILKYLKISTGSSRVQVVVAY